jgi:hypothetical protein
VTAVDTASLPTSNAGRPQKEGEVFALRGARQRRAMNLARSLGMFAHALEEVGLGGVARSHKRSARTNDRDRQSPPGPTSLGGTARANGRQSEGGTAALRSSWPAWGRPLASAAVPARRRTITTCPVGGHR